jgi:spermidine/putrescine transport system substrate-binding protein
VSLKNFNWNGYQPPLNKLTPEFLVDEGYVPDSVTNAVVQPEDFAEGIQGYETTPAVQNLYLAAFQEFQSGGS